MQYPSDDSDEDVTQNMYDLSIQGLEPLTEEKATNTDYITVTDVSDDVVELLSILPNAINSLKDAGMYTEWINYIRMLGSNEFPLKNIDLFHVTEVGLKIMYFFKGSNFSGRTNWFAAQS